MKIRKLKRPILASLVVAMLAGPAYVAAEQPGYWPEDEDDQKLKELDSEVLRLQEARFRAIFAEEKDEKEIKRIQKDFEEAQKARRDMLRKTGRY